MATTDAPTYLLIDGENIDATLGMSVLNRRPNPEERPRWDRVLQFAAGLWAAGDDADAGGSDGSGGSGYGMPAPGGTSRNGNGAAVAPAVKGLFFLNATSGQMPMSFVQALLAMDFTPIPLAGSGTEKVVDIGIQRTMDAILARGTGNVLLASHDGDYIPQVEALLDAGHEVAVLAFREFVNAELQHLTERGLTIHDLEDSVGAFNAVLPRVRIIPLDVFDPTRYLL